MKLEEIKTALEIFFKNGYKNINIDNEIVSVMPSDDGENIEIVFKDDAENIVITKWGAFRPQYNLKPCPFCEGEPYLQYFDGIYDYGPQEPTYCVECLDCGAEGPTCESGAEAIEAWNRRGES